MLHVERWPHFTFTILLLLEYGRSSDLILWHTSRLCQQMRAERKKYDKEARHEMAQIKADAFKQNKIQRSLEVDSQRAHFESAKEKHEMNQHIKEKKSR